MRLRRQRHWTMPHCLALALWGGMLLGRADVLIGTNGDRFTGKVLKETADSVVFDSELGGKLTIPRTRIREIQRAQPPITDNRSLITNGAPALPNAPWPTRPLPRHNQVKAG